MVEFWEHLIYFEELVFDFSFDGTKYVQKLGLLISDKVYKEAIKIVTDSKISSGFLVIFFERTIH